MRYFIINLLKYGSLSLLIINSIGWAGDSVLRKSSFFKPSFLVNNFNPTDNFDYMILGSSRGLTTLNTIQVDGELGLNGINLSMDDTDLKSHVLMLDHFFANGYKSEYCILVLDYSNFNKTQIRLGDNDYRFSPFIKQGYVREHFGKYESVSLKPNYNSLLFPFLKYSYYNLQLVPASAYALIYPDKRHRFDEKGNYTYPINKSISQKTKSSNIIKSQLTNPLLEQVKSLCEQNGSRLLVYIAPYQDLIIQLKDSANVINHSGLISSKEYFYDKLHVNSKGRAIASNHFIEALTRFGLKHP